MKKKAEIIHHIENFRNFVRALEKYANDDKEYCI